MAISQLSLQDSKRSTICMSTCMMLRMEVVGTTAKDLVRFFMEAGSNIEARDNGKMTALHWASVNGNEGEDAEQTNWNLRPRAKHQVVLPGMNPTAM